MTKMNVPTAGSHYATGTTVGSKTERKRYD